MKISKKNIQDFEKYLKDEEKAHLTVDKYVRDVGKLREFFCGQKSGFMLK